MNATNARPRPLLVLLCLALPACYLPSSGPPPVVLPTVDGRAVAAQLEQQTRLEAPARIGFDWSISEQGARQSGRGVTRSEPPYLARLDLFTSNGETVARATLVDDDLSVPSGLPEGLIPPPHLLWAALGVFRPGRNAAYLGATGDPLETVELRYGYPGGLEVRYRVTGGRIREVDGLEGGQVVHRVTLSPGDGRYPVEATYQNRSDFRELRLTTQTIDHVESYPPDIWLPGR